MPTKVHGPSVRPVGAPRVSRTSLPFPTLPAPTRAQARVQSTQAPSPFPPIDHWNPPDLHERAAQWDDDLLLSVVVGSYNRFTLLQQCVESIRLSVGAMAYEIIVADGGSTDGSTEWCAEQPDVVLVDGGLKGAVAATNAGVRAARGNYIALLNDDVRVVDDALLLAVGRLKDDETIGQIACAWKTDREHQYKFEYVYNIYYANLGVIRRSVADLVLSITGGLWSPCYHTYGGDTELSCWVSRLGYKVVPLATARMDDRHAMDALRMQNMKRGGRTDGRTFHRRWGSPQMLRPGGPEPQVTRRELAALRRLERR